MSYNHRPLSPGGRRVHNAGRMSDQALNNPYYDQRHNPYASPRSSGTTFSGATSGVIPISTQTFVNVPPPSQARPEQRYDSYSGRPLDSSGRPRKSSLVDVNRASSSTTQLPSRSRPTVIQQEYNRPASPKKPVRETTSTTSDYYITPASSISHNTHNTSTATHKKLYTVDDGTAKLVADVNMPVPVQAGGERHHRRRESVERGYAKPGAERERGRKHYYANGTHGRPRDKSIDDEGAYEYTDPAAMYRDTEPRWRPEARQRRGSMDRGGAVSRERPVSVLDPTFGTRTSTKEVGPPPSTRGWDKINDNLGRTSSVRDPPRVAQSPTRGRTHHDSAYADQYYVPPRTNSIDRRQTIHNYDNAYDYDDLREPRRERRQSITREGGRAGDRSLERRGFGINPALYRQESQTRYGGRDARGSDESIDYSRQHRDSGFVAPAYVAPVEPHRRETAPAYPSHDTARLEQDKRDRESTFLQPEGHRRTRERGNSDVREYSKIRDRDISREPRRRDDTGYTDDYDRPRDRDYERDRERERERARQMDPPSNRDHERHHERRGTADRREQDRERDRDRDYGRKENSRKEDSPRQSTDAGNSKPGLAQAATGGLAGAAAAFGLKGLLNKVSEKRDKDKDDDRDQDRGDRKDRSDRKDRDERRERDERRDRDERRERDERKERDDRRNGEDRDSDTRTRERRPAKTARDEGRNPEPDRQRDSDRGLGFAFEAPPEPPRSAPPNATEWNMSQERQADRVPGEYPTQERKPDRAPELSQPPNNDRSNDNRQPQDRDQDRAGARDYADTAGAKVQMPSAPLDPAEEDYRRRMEQVQRELGRATLEDQRGSESDPDRERRRREREQRQREREARNGGPGSNFSSGITEMPPYPSAQRSYDHDEQSTMTGMTGTNTASSLGGELRRKPSILDQPMTDEPAQMAQIIDNTQSDRRENRVRIVDPPTDEEERNNKPKGILKKPTQKFPEDPNAVREGVAPLKDATKKGIPPGARWTKIDRRLVNPEALEAAHERFEERLDCVIVLRVLTKEEIQKLADCTREIRDKRYEEDKHERKSSRRPDRNRERRERGEYEYSDSEDEFKEKQPKMLEAPSTVGSSSNADFIRDNRDRRHERDRETEQAYMSGGNGRRDESQSRY